MQIDVTIHFDRDPELAKALATILAIVESIQTKGDHFMSTTNQGLAKLQADIAALQAANTQILADVTKLLANQSPGLQPGQVIVNQADIDALDATVQGITGADTAADATVNPPAPPASPAPTAAVKKSGLE